MSRRRTNERGAALVEFALVALVFYLLVAGTVELGRLVFVAQVAESAARTAAREFALAPLPAEYSLAAAYADPLYEPIVRRVFDPDRLVIDLDALPPGGSVDAAFDDPAMPAVNRALRPAMIFDRPVVGGVERRLLRLPGALIVAPGSPSGFSVAVPRVVERAEDGTETIEWLPVLEEIGNSFPLAADGSGGLAAIRLNIPFQAAALSAWRPGADPPAVAGTPIVANDAGVAELGAAPGALALAGGGPSTYGGPFGLGAQLALGQKVRPFRRLVTGQAVFRREAFAEQSP